MRRLTRTVGVLVATTMVATGACSSSGSKGAAPTSPATTQATGSPATTVAPPRAAAPAGTSISIKGFAFQPAEMAAKVGDTISVTNEDGTDHSLTAVDGSFDTGRFSSGAKTIKVDKAGRFEFKCEVHSFMPHGFIQVSG